jgi:hypothetical protein
MSFFFISPGHLSIFELLEVYRVRLFVPRLLSLLLSLFVCERENRTTLRPCLLSQESFPRVYLSCIDIAET